MATRIRLQRHGKKGKAFFHLVAADSRAKRDGKFIEKLGIYNPNTNPATIEINFDRTLSWVQVGAEMSETARAILSYKGVLHKNHLLNGVKKGALSTEQAEAKFAAWLAEKDAKVSGKSEGLAKNAAADKATRMKAEAEANIAKAAALEAKNNPVEEVVEEAPEVEAAAEEATEEAPVAVEETTEEAPVSEALVEETTEEAPAAEAVVEETTEEATEAPAEEAGEEEASAQ
ncbi:MAG: 30S ribosomal protein S16 [Crocinitomicaceae bacterium]|nr:30S ribosomal protein S16 [Crocinitomicaceae bacterium]